MISTWYPPVVLLIRAPARVPARGVIRPVASVRASVVSIITVGNMRYRKHVQKNVPRTRILVGDLCTGPDRSPRQSYCCVDMSSPVTIHRRNQVWARDEINDAC